MIESLVYVLIGAFIGWNFPQPEWSKKLQAKVMSIFKKD